MCLRFNCTATWKQHSLSVPFSTNFTLPFGYTDSVCDVKKPLSAFICHVQQANISALLGQMVQEAAEWTVTSCGLFFSQSSDSGLLLERDAWTIGFSISVGSAAVGGRFCLIAGLAASITLGKMQLHCCFRVYAEILCSFYKLFWRDASGSCSQELGGIHVDICLL